MMNFLKSMWKSEKGGTMVEYALLAGLLIMPCIMGVTFIGERVNGEFNRVQNIVMSAGSSASTPKGSHLSASAVSAGSTLRGSIGSPPVR